MLLPWVKVLFSMKNNICKKIMASVNVRGSWYIGMFSETTYVGVCVKIRRAVSSEEGWGLIIWSFYYLDYKSDITILQRLAKLELIESFI